MSSPSKLATSVLSATNDYTLFQGILENLVDGVLIVTPQGRWLYGNRTAYRICQELGLRSPIPEGVPDAIWQLCQRFLEQRINEDDRIPLIEAEICQEPLVRYRVRIRWLSLEESKSPYLLVTLEDCYDAAKNRAIAEIQQYNLTSRQADVWILHRTGHSYRDIASKLFVTHNTVKRHMKDIHAKQRMHEL